MPTPLAQAPRRQGMATCFRQTGQKARQKTGSETLSPSASGVPGPQPRAPDRRAGLASEAADPIRRGASGGVCVQGIGAPAPAVPARGLCASP